MTPIPLPWTATSQGRIGRTQEESVPRWPESDAATPRFPVSVSDPGAFLFTGRLERVVFTLSASEETTLFEAED